MPYILFYIGFFISLASTARPDLFTVARYENIMNFLFYYNVILCRIILAIDLEIWYLLSLRFASAIKLLGPKLFMIGNMVIIITHIFENNFISI